MIRVVNNLIPFKGYTAMTVWPFLFIRKGVKVSDKLIRHEEIHATQQKEMLIVFFYVWYVMEWLVRCLMYCNMKAAYKNVSFEREAKTNETNAAYLEERRLFSWVKYIKG